MSFAMLQEIDRIKRTCILCGRCTATCPSCAHGGIDPMEIMAGGELNLEQCIMCGNCSRTCRRSDPFTVIRCMIYMERGLSVSNTFRETGFIRPPAENRLIDPIWTGDDAYVMLGCTVNSVVPYLEYAASVATNAVGVGASCLPDEKCCMHVVQFMDIPQFERRDFRKNVCGPANGKEIVTLCAGCWEEFSQVYEKTSHIIGFLHSRLEKLPVFEKKIRVGMEPGCSASPLKKEMRAILEKMNCEIVNTDFGCCGKTAPVAEELMKEREAECEGADLIVVGCPTCLNKFDSYAGGIPTVHIAELVAMASGHCESLAFHRIPVTVSSR